MLKKRYIVYSLILVLVLTSCHSGVREWQSGKVVAQVFRSYNSNILFSYTDFVTPIIQERQRGYERAYFDNDRKQVIFTTGSTNEYLIDGVQVSTADNGITGYVSQVLTNEYYQIGVEILDITYDDLQSDRFDGTSRIIDLNTKRSITIPGLLFNRNLIFGHYFYGTTFDDENHLYFDMIDLRTMEHKREQRTFGEDIITFVYQREDKLYAQVADKQQTFLVDGLELIEVTNMYDARLPIMEGGTQVLKNIGPRNSGKHWYIEDNDSDDGINEVKFIQVEPDGIKTTWLKFSRNDIIQLVDVANYGEDKIALYLMAKTETGEFIGLITSFDVFGNELETIEVIENDVGHFTHLDYVE